MTGQDRTGQDKTFLTLKGQYSDPCAVRCPHPPSQARLLNCQLVVQRRGLTPERTWHWYTPGSGAGGSLPGTVQGL